jgi:GntR family transcriptional regulator, transcriptional repressor for pyruvate dehydrogenase complex
MADGQTHLPRLANVVAERIRELILLGDLKDGERLPPLDTMLEQFGVSAPSMREALRILEAEGLVVVQRGSIGGALVKRPTAKTAAYTLALVLRSQGTQKGDVAEAIAVLEPLCATLCARRTDRKTKVVRELRKLNAAARKLLDGDELAFNETMLEFHRMLVRRAGNDTVTLLTRSLGYIWAADVRAWVTSTAAHGHYPTPEGRLPEVECHERITDLIEAGDVEGVAQAMTEHLDVGRVYREGIDPDQRVDPQAVRFSG